MRLFQLTGPARNAIKCAGFVFLLSTHSIQPLAAQSTPQASKIGALLRSAQTALQANDTASASREFAAVLALDPRNVEARVDVGVIQMFQGNCQSASQHFHRALALQPSLVKAQALLGICDRRLGADHARVLLESSFAKLKEPKLRTQVGMELVGLYYQQGDIERATGIVPKLVDLNPDDVDILYMAQQLYSELAEGTLNKLAILAPASARMQQVIAERLVNSGDLNRAIEHYRKALEINPRLPGVHYELAEAILESAPTDSAAQVEAEKEIEIAISSERDNAKMQCELGRIATLRSDTPAAFSHYTRAYQMNPQDAGAQLGLGRVLMTMEKAAQARKYLELAVKSDPLNNEAHYRLALAYRRLHLDELAQKEMHLFQEIKQTKERVRQLYKEMNRQTKSEPDEDVEAEK